MHLAIFQRQDTRFNIIYNLFLPVVSMSSRCKSTFLLEPKLQPDQITFASLDSFGSDLRLLRTTSERRRYIQLYSTHRELI